MNLESCDFSHESVQNCTALKSISIPESVTAIGWRAFFNSYNLKTIELPETVVNISRDAFYNTGYFNDNNNWEDGALYLGKHLIRYDFTKAASTEEYKVKRWYFKNYCRCILSS